MTADQAFLIANLYNSLIQKRRAYLELLTRHEQGETAQQLRADALESARLLALAQRTYWAGVLLEPDYLKGVSEDLAPTAAVYAIARLGYALTGLADDDCIPEMLLSRAEAEGLFDAYNLESWFSAIESGVSEEMQAQLEARP